MRLFWMSNYPLLLKIINCGDKFNLSFVLQMAGDLGKKMVSLPILLPLSI